MIDFRTKGLLICICDHCKRIQEIIKGIDRETFLNDLGIQEMVCFNLLQIGELVKHIDKITIHKYNGVDWINIGGLRDHIVHGYGQIELPRIWTIIQKDVQVLLNYCQSILSQEKTD